MTRRPRVGYGAQARSQLGMWDSGPKRSQPGMRSGLKRLGLEQEDRLLGIGDHELIVGEHDARASLQGIEELLFCIHVLAEHLRRNDLLDAQAIFFKGVGAGKAIAAAESLNGA